MGRIDGRYMAIYALCTRLKTGAYTGRVHGPFTDGYTAVYTYIHVHGP